MSEYNYEYEERKRWRDYVHLYWLSLWRNASTPALKEAYRRRMLDAESVLMNYGGMKI